MTSRAEVNRAAVARWLNTAGPQQVLGGVAKDITDKAKQLAPARTQYYRRSLMYRPYRNGWRVESVDPFAHLVEWGSINNPPYAPVRKAILAARAKARYVPGPKG